MFTRKLLHNNLKGSKPLSPKTNTPQGFFTSLKNLISFNSKNIGKVYGLDPVTTISQVDHILASEEEISEKIYMVNHVKNCLQTSPLHDFATLSHSYNSLREQYLTSELTKENIALLTSEELYAVVNNLMVNDNPDIANWCLIRFYELISEDINTDASSIDEEGRITVDMRVLEPHLFSKIMGALSLNPDLYFQTENIEDLGQYAMVYIKRHRLNFSFDDKSLSLVSVLSFANPTPGNFQIDFSFLTQNRTHELCQTRNLGAKSFHQLQLCLESCPGFSNLDLSHSQWKSESKDRLQQFYWRAGRAHSLLIRR